MTQASEANPDYRQASSHVLGRVLVANNTFDNTITYHLIAHIWPTNNISATGGYFLINVLPGIVATPDLIYDDLGFTGKQCVQLLAGRVLKPLLGVSVSLMAGSAGQ